MGLPLPTMVEFLKFAEEAKARRKATADKSLLDLIDKTSTAFNHGLLSDKDVN